MDASERNASPPLGVRYHSIFFSVPSQSVDFDAIRKNAKEQNIPLRDIAILYAGLSVEEWATLVERGLLASPLDRAPLDGTAIAYFPEDGEIPFQEKATGVHYLAAD